MSSSQGYPLPHRLSFINRPTIRPVAHRTHTFLSFISFWGPSLILHPDYFSFQKFDTFYWAEYCKLSWASASATNEPARGRPPRRIVCSDKARIGIGIGRLWCWSSVSSLSLICMEICVEKIFETDILKICWNGNLLATLVALLASFIDELRPTINTYIHICMCVCLWIILGCALIYALDRIRLA